MIAANQTLVYAADMKVTVVVPVLYEEPQLGASLSQLSALRAQIDLETLVVIDVPDPSRARRSKDVNDPIVAAAGARLLYRVGGRGFGSALRYAFRQAAGDAVIPFMGDGSDCAEDIPAMVKELERGFDVVAGSRYMRGGKTIGMTLKQRISHLYSAAVRTVGALPIHDISNAFKAYRREVLEATSTVATSFDISVELTVKAAQAGFRLGEIPTTWTNRELGASNFHFSREVPNYWRWFVLAARSRRSAARARANATRAKGPS